MKFFFNSEKVNFEYLKENNFFNIAKNFNIFNIKTIFRDILNNEWKACLESKFLNNFLKNYLKIEIEDEGFKRFEIHFKLSLIEYFDINVYTKLFLFKSFNNYLISDSSSNNLYSKFIKDKFRRYLTKRIKKIKKNNSKMEQIIDVEVVEMDDITSNER